MTASLRTSGLVLALAGVFAIATPLGAAVPAAPATPVTMLQIMRASVEIPAEGVWDLATVEGKLSDEQWRLADQDTVNLVVAATLMTLPTAGKDDAKRMAAADWRGWAAEVRKTALRMREAVKARDQMKLSMLGDQMVDTCQACHDKYRPETPSDGVARFPFYPKRVLAASDAPDAK